MRAFAQLLQCHSIEDARHLIQSIAVVALSESEGNDEAGTPVMSEICKRGLKTRIAEGYNPDICLDDEMGLGGMTEESPGCMRVTYVYGVTC